MDVDDHGRGGHGAAPPKPIQHAHGHPSPSSPLDQCTGQKKALLIGIKTSEGYPELTAAHSDVDKMRWLLLDVYKYTPTEITVLRDDETSGHIQPTRPNILAAIEDFVRDVKEGDRLFFYYSGHSTQVDNSRSNSEEDGKDECLVPLEGEKQKIVDNELHNALVKPLPPGSRLVAVLDTCHSGSLLDLKHYRCNRVPVPWVWRGRRSSEPIRNAVVRRGARFITLSQTIGPHDAQTPRRCSVVSVRCDFLAPPASLRSSTGMSAKSSTAPLRTASAQARRKLSVVIPSSFAGNDADTVKDKENLIERAAAKLRWIFPEKERHCDSPVARFPCSGWCRDIDKRVHVEDDEAADEVRADVISLASCKDSQKAYDEGGISLTSSLVDLLRENPHQSLKDVLICISHATHSFALTRHGRAKIYKRQRMDLIAKLVARIRELEDDSTTSISLSPSHSLSLPPSVPSLPSPPTLTARAASKEGVRRTSLIQRLKNRLQEVRKIRGGFDLDSFQNPELASPRPLDMNRPWWM
ncbi:caspase domain-containing protein [Mycena vitilis]|nr:caspase domain-containing protein [Mycena vitilis]